MSYSDIPGYSGFLWLYEEFVKSAPKDAVAVEVGVALGHSIAYLARICIDAKREDIQIWAIDPWAGYARNGEQQEKLGADGTRGDFSLFVDMMIRHAPAELELVRVVRAPSARAARLFRLGSVDLVLIDAAHDEQSVRDDIDAWLPRVRSGGTIAGDDHEANYPGVEEACRARWSRGGYEVKGTTWRKVVA